LSISEQREIELKYRVQEQALWETLRTLEQLLDGYLVGPTGVQDTVDVYWDTPDFALTRGGFGLRSRYQKGQWLVTLKEITIAGTMQTQHQQQIGLADRIELEAELAANFPNQLDRQPTFKIFERALSPQAWPPSLWQQVRFTQPNPKVRPIAVLQQSREKRALFHKVAGQKQHLGEMSLDQVWVFAPPADPRPSSQWITAPERLLPKVGNFCEVEFEAASVSQHQYFLALAEQLPKAYALTASTAGKAETALRLLAQVGNDGQWGIQPDTVMGDALRLLWRRQFVELLLNEIKVHHNQDEEGVHDMRVAIRRMRAAARIFKSHVPKKELRPLLKMLRSTANVLGHARDLDISLALLEHSRQVVGGEDDADLVELINSWRAQRTEAYLAVQAWFGQEEYSRFIAKLGKFCTLHSQEQLQADHGSGRMAQQVRHCFPGKIMKRYANMRIYETVTTEAMTLKLFHKLRIEGKRLRYCLEFVQHLLEPTVAPLLIKKLKTIQDCLGNLNDAATMQERLAALDVARADSSAMQAIQSHLDDVIHSEQTKFWRLWQDFLHVETRQQLAQAIAYL
jgi:CHAD domain-containing protein